MLVIHGLDEIKIRSGIRRFVLNHGNSIVGLGLAVMEQEGPEFLCNAQVVAYFKRSTAEFLSLALQFKEASLSFACGFDEGNFSLNALEFDLDTKRIIRSAHLVSKYASEKDSFSNTFFNDFLTTLEIVNSTKVEVFTENWDEMGVLFYKGEWGHLDYSDIWTECLRGDELISTAI